MPNSTAGHRPWNEHASAPKGPLLLAFLFLSMVVSGCDTDKPRYVATTCDFVTAPARYQKQDLELTGSVTRAESGKWMFETYCDGPKRLPLRWADGVEPPRDLADLSRGDAYSRSERNTVAGRIVSGDDGEWTVEARQYFRAVFTK